MASELNRCPNCGEPIPVEAPQGLCPKCVLLQASIPTNSGQGVSSKSAPPTREELSAAFPQLEVLELIGQGGMGFVFKARQPKLDRFVALKILPQTLAADPAFAGRFTREGRVLARLNHPNIVTIHDFGQANGFFYLLMEFVDGVNLRQAMRSARFTPAEALGVVPRICEALQYAHNEGVLHRDIKPENILLDAKGRVKIADFGIAKLAGEPHAEDRLTASQGALGTPHYMAPEQIEKPSEVDHRADIYSLGVVFYEMLTGELPLGRFAPPSEKSTADPRLDEVVFRTLEKEPNRRQQSADEVKTQVETIATSAPDAKDTASAQVKADSPSSTPTPPWVRRAGILFLVLAGVALLPTLNSFGSAVFVWNGCTMLAFTGIALLLRDQAWRLLALALNWLLLASGLLNASLFLLLETEDKLAFNAPWRVAGASDYDAGIVVLGFLEVLACVGGIAILSRGDVRSLFDRSWPAPRRWIWPGLAVILMHSLMFGLPRLASSLGLLTPVEIVDSSVRVSLPQELPAPPIHESKDEPAYKTIELNKATNRLGGVALSTASSVFPGERLRAVMKHPDGRIEDGVTTFITSRRGDNVRSFSGFHWRFSDSFSAEDIDAVIAQLQMNMVGRPLRLASGEPRELFTVTNRGGGVMRGLLAFNRSRPEALKETSGAIARPQASVSGLRTASPSSLLIFFSASVPAGYALQATGNSSDASDIETATTLGHSSNFADHYSSSWFIRPSPDPEQLREANAQLQALAQRGSIRVLFGEPCLLFSITNKTGAVHRGFLELAGPPSDTVH